MNKMTQVFLSVMAVFLIVGCASQTTSGPTSTRTGRPLTGPDLDPEAHKQVLKDEPTFYRNHKVKEGYIPVKGEGTSPSKALAREIAKSALVSDLQQKTKSIIETRTSNFMEQTGAENSSELVQKYSFISTNVMNGMVENWEEVKSETTIERNPDKKSENIYRCYIVGKWNRHSADQEFLEKLKNEKALMAAFQETKAYEKMQADLERYREKLGM